MYHDQMLQKTLTDNSNLHQVILSEAKKEQAQTHELTFPDIAISSVSLIVAWIGFFLILRKAREFLDDKMVFSIKGLDKLPCKNCHFYSNNHHLKCAVNPSIVLTKEAINCSEYSPDQNKKSFKNPFG